MDDNGHLVQTFYITALRPQISQSPTTHLLSSDEQSNLDHGLLVAEDCQKLTIQKKLNLTSSNKSQCKKNKSQCNKIFKMITNKISPSTAVNTPNNLKQLSQTRRSSVDKVVTSFEHFFAGLIKDESNSEETHFSREHPKDSQHPLATEHPLLPEHLKETVNSKQTAIKVHKKSANRIKSLQTNRNDHSFEDQDIFGEQTTKKQRKMSYHQRIKEKIDNKLDNIFKHSHQKRHQILIDHHPTINISQVLWLKNSLRKAQPKLRLSKTGLPIHLRELEHRIINSHNKTLEREKAKKDHLFQRTLAKNNAITLNSIQSYQRRVGQKMQERRVGSQRLMSQSRCLKETVCSQNRKKVAKNKRKSCEDLTQMKLAQKCIQIEWDCEDSSLRYRGVERGFKAFEGFSRVVEQRLALDAEVMAAMARKKPNKNTRNQTKFLVEHQQSVFRPHEDATQT